MHASFECGGMQKSKNLQVQKFEADAFLSRKIREEGKEKKNGRKSRNTVNH